jgi:hypothetical protein
MQIEFRIFTFVKLQRFDFKVFFRFPVAIKIGVVGLAQWLKW